MGIATILKSKEILLLVSEMNKAETIYRMFSREVSTEFSASVLRKNPNVIIVADKEAISVLAYKIDTRMSIKI